MKAVKAVKAIVIDLLLMLGIAVLPAAAMAQSWPERPVRIIVPYPPGGGTDLFARLISQDLAKQFEKQVIVDNRSGANGNIGAEFVSKAAPDGHVLLYTASPIAVSKVLSKNVRFDAQRDLRPISMTISIPLVLAVHPSLPVRNVKEVIALAKAKPGALTYSSSGPGASGHFTMELLNLRAASTRATSRIAARRRRSRRCSQARPRWRSWCRRSCRRTRRAESSASSPCPAAPAHRCCRTCPRCRNRGCAISRRSSGTASSRRQRSPTR